MNATTAVVQLGLAIQKALLINSKMTTNSTSAISKELVATLKDLQSWISDPDLARDLDGVPQGVETVQELRGVMAQAANLAETYTRKGFASRLVYADQYRTRLEEKLKTLRDIQNKLSFIQSRATLRKVGALVESSRIEGLPKRHNLPELQAPPKPHEELMERLQGIFWPARSSRELSRTIVCLWGSPSIGKGRLAGSYGHKNLNRYDCVLWVDIFGRGIKTGYVDMGADVLGVNRDSREDLESHVQRVKLAVGSLDKLFLLVFNGIESEEAESEVRRLLPAANQACHVLVTTTDELALRQEGAVSLKVEGRPGELHLHSARRLVT